MDQTELFRAVVKAVRLQLKAQREATGSVTSVHLSSFKTTKKLTQFTAAANDVVNYYCSAFARALLSACCLAKIALYTLHKHTWWRMCFAP